MAAAVLAMEQGVEEVEGGAEQGVEEEEEEDESRQITVQFVSETGEAPFPPFEVTSTDVTQVPYGPPFTPHLGVER